MLFDLKSGKRRRVVQIVFGFLAFVFFISFVGFGIGSDVSGGIFDALGIGGDGGSSDPQYEQQIEDAETTLETDPENEQALLDLARYQYLTAQSQVTQDPATGQTSIPEDARGSLETSVAAWSDYLATKPNRPDSSVATNAAQAYVFLGDADGAAEAQQVVADEQKSASAYGQLAYYLYAAGRIDAGDAAADEAVAAADPAERKQIAANYAQLSKQAAKLAKQQRGQQGSEAAGEAALQDPFGGLSGAGTSPVAPAP